MYLLVYLYAAIRAASGRLKESSCGPFRSVVKGNGNALLIHTRLIIITCLLKFSVPCNVQPWQNIRLHRFLFGSKSR